MNPEIRPLTPDMSESYLRFFDETPHDVNVDEKKCYCVTWRSDESYENAPYWFDTREERRTHAGQFVREGSIRGYLAFVDGKIVGWCNANEHCRLCLDYLRNFWPIEEYREDVRVKSIFCFVISPAFQRQGIATEMVRFICREAADDGFDFVEAYVFDPYDETIHDFRGPISMYEKCGFTRHAERDGKVVMRKALR